MFYLKSLKHNRYSCCVIRCMSASESGAWRPPNLEYAVHRIRRMSATLLELPESWTAWIGRVADMARINMG